MEDHGGDTMLAQRLRTARQDAGLTQVALAHLADVSQRNISDLETERRGRRVEPPLLRRLAQILGVTVGYLLGDSDEPFNIPGWSDLTELQRTEIRGLIELRGRLNRDLAAADARGSATPPSESALARGKVDRSPPVKTGRGAKPRGARE
jgi:transcriptional regulator with XRE-family HTH domain